MPPSTPATDSLLRQAEFERQVLWGQNYPGVVFRTHNVVNWKVEQDRLQCFRFAGGRKPLFDPATVTAHELACYHCAHVVNTPAGENSYRPIVSTSASCSADWRYLTYKGRSADLATTSLRFSALAVDYERSQPAWASESGALAEQEGVNTSICSKTAFTWTRTYGAINQELLFTPDVVSLPGQHSSQAIPALFESIDPDIVQELETLRRHTSNDQHDYNAIEYFDRCYYDLLQAEDGLTLNKFDALLEMWTSDGLVGAEDGPSGPLGAGVFTLLPLAKVIGGCESVEEARAKLIHLVRSCADAPYAFEEGVLALEALAKAKNPE